MTSSIGVKRAVLAGLLALACLLPFVASATPARAHVAYNTEADCCTRFQHHVHGRDITIWNQIGRSTWWDLAREAQLHLHSIFNGSLRFPTASSSALAVVTMVDATYQEEFLGRAYRWRYHGGFDGRLQMNLAWAGVVNAFQVRGNVCHELGHFVGLQHSTDASDCMHTYWSQMQSQNLAVAHRDQMRDMWNATGH